MKPGEQPYDAELIEGWESEISRSAYSAGLEAGLVEGQRIALASNPSEQFQAGYETGVADTKRLPQATYQEGYDDGYAAGAENGFASAD